MSFASRLLHHTPVVIETRAGDRVPVVPLETKFAGMKREFSLGVYIVDENRCVLLLMSEIVDMVLMNGPETKQASAAFRAYCKAEKIKVHHRRSTRRRK